MDEGEVSSGEFFASNDDPSIVLHIEEHDLDLVAFFVEKPVGFALDQPCGMGWDDRFCLLCSDSFEDGVAS